MTSTSTTTTVPNSPPTTGYTPSPGFNPQGSGTPAPVLTDPSADPGNYHLSASQANISITTPVLPGLPTGAPAISVGGYVPDTNIGGRQESMLSAMQELAKLPTSALSYLQHELWAGGFYGDQKTPPVYGHFDDATERAYASLLLQSAMSGQTGQDALTQAITTNGGNPNSANPSTGTPQDQTNNAPATGIIGHGANMTIDLTNPTDLNYAADKMEEMLLGRLSTPDEKAQLIKEIQDAQTQQGMTKYQAAEQAAYNNFLENVQNRNNTINDNKLGTAGNTGPTQSDLPGQQAGTQAFLAAIRWHESGSLGYTANSGDGAYGAYQFIPSTWNSEATAAGYSQYANGRADMAPPQVQDAVAAYMANKYYQEAGGDWGKVAQGWYGGEGMINADPNKVPVPGTNNNMTLGSYAKQITDHMAQTAGTSTSVTPNQGQGTNFNSTPTQDPSTSPTSALINYAKSFVGTPYVWGGTTPSGFDCSGFVQYVMKAFGLDPTRTTSTQINNRAGQAINGLSNAMPGDVIFFGGTSSNPLHEGLYLGNGQMIDAPHTGSTVGVHAVAGYGTIVGIRRFTLASSSTTQQPGPAAPQTIQGAGGSTDTFTPGTDTTTTNAPSPEAQMYADSTTGPRQAEYLAHTASGVYGTMLGIIKSNGTSPSTAGTGGV